MGGAPTATLPLSPPPTTLVDGWVALQACRCHLEFKHVLTRNACKGALFCVLALSCRRPGLSLSGSAVVAEKMLPSASPPEAKQHRGGQLASQRPSKKASTVPCSYAAMASVVRWSRVPLSNICRFRRCEDSRLYSSSRPSSNLRRSMRVFR